MKTAYLLGGGLVALALIGVAMSASEDKSGGDITVTPGNTNLPPVIPNPGGVPANLPIIPLTFQGNNSPPIYFNPNANQVI